MKVMGCDGMRGRQVTTAEKSHKDGHHNKSSIRQATRLARRWLPFRQLLRYFQFFHFPKPVRVHIAFLHLMASTPSVLIAFYPRSGSGSGGSDEEEGKKGAEINEIIPPGGRRCSVQPVMMSGNKYRLPPAVRMRGGMLYLQVFIAGGEQINTL